MSMHRILLSGCLCLLLCWSAALSADFDGDNDVDQEDFGYFQACLAGSEQPVSGECEIADLDCNTFVDQDSRRSISFPTIAIPIFVDDLVVRVCFSAFRFDLCCARLDWAIEFSDLNPIRFLFLYSLWYSFSSSLYFW